MYIQSDDLATFNAALVSSWFCFLCVPCEWHSNSVENGMKPFSLHIQTHIYLWFWIFDQREKKKERRIWKVTYWNITHSSWQSFFSLFFVLFDCFMSHLNHFCRIRFFFVIIIFDFLFAIARDTPKNDTFLMLRGSTGETDLSVPLNGSSITNQFHST